MSSAWARSALVMAFVFWAVGATAQSTDTARMRATIDAVIGCSTFPTATSLRACSIGARTPGQDILSINSANGDVLKGPLATVDIPTVFTRRDLAETINQAWLFNAGVQSPFVVSGGSSLSLAALGVDNARFGINAGTPRAIFEDAGAGLQWQMDNAGGQLRFARLDATGGCPNPGCVTLSLSDFVTFDPKAKAVLPAVSYDIDLGSPIKKFRVFHGAEMDIETIVSQFIMATMGGRIMVAPTAKLISDITSTQTTIVVDNNNFANGDTSHAEGYGRFEDMLVVSGATLVNRCPTSGSCATADTTTSWAVDSGSLTLSRDVFYQGDASLAVPNTASLIEFNDGTSWMTNGATYTIQVVMRRSDDGPIVPTGSAYRLYCSAVDLAPTTIADDLGSASTGHWYRLHGSCTHSTGVGRVGVTSIPTGGVTHNFDQVQVEVGTTMTPWSQFASSYTVTRNRDGSGGNAWVAGTALVNTGHAGSGMIDIYSTNGAYSGTQIGPTICGNVRNSNTYNDISTRWCLGQLQGIASYGSSTFGMWAGSTTGTNIAVETTNGVIIKNGSRIVGQWDMSGNVVIGGRNTNDPQVSITPSVLQMCVSGVACYLTMDGATGDIRGGSATALNTGTGYFIGGSGTSRFGSPTGDFWRFDGTNLDLKARNLSINSNGITITGSASGTWDQAKAYRFDYGDGRNNGMSSIQQGQIDIRAQNGALAVINLTAENVSGSDAFVQLLSQTGGLGSRIRAVVDNFEFTISGLSVNGVAGVTKTCTSLPTVVNGIVTGC